MEQKNYRLRQALVQQLESLERSGVMQMAKSKPSGKSASAQRASAAKPAVKPAGKPAAAAPMAATTEPVRSPQPKQGLAKKTAASATLSVPMAKSKPSSACANSDSVTEQLAVIQAEVAGCTSCKELARTRTQTVFGDGNHHPRLCFLGEAPGADEDEQGIPFVGRAGQLLNNIIEACKMRRDEVYILNILKCRPPGNRLPLPQEAANCRGFLERQLELLQPEFICCLGACASHNLLQTDVAIGKLRGTFFDYGSAKVICTYHPAYLLRNPDAKKYVWDDMKRLMQAMGRPIK